MFLFSIVTSNTKHKISLKCDCFDQSSHTHINIHEEQAQIRKTSITAKITRPILNGISSITNGVKSSISWAFSQSYSEEPICHCQASEIKHTTQTPSKWSLHPSVLVCNMLSFFLAQTEFESCLPLTHSYDDSISESSSQPDTPSTLLSTDSRSQIVHCDPGRPSKTVPCSSLISKSRWSENDGVVNSICQQSTLTVDTIHLVDKNLYEGPARIAQDHVRPGDRFKPVKLHPINEVTHSINGEDVQMDVLTDLKLEMAGDEEMGCTTPIMEKGVLYLSFFLLLGVHLILIYTFCNYTFLSTLIVCLL